MTSKLLSKLFNSETNKWTPQELKILEENFGRVDKNTLLQLLPNRSWSAIKTVAYKKLKIRMRERQRAILKETARKLSEQRWQTPDIVKYLANQGFGYRMIASELKIPFGTAYRWLYPEKMREHIRKWRKKNSNSRVWAFLHGHSYRRNDKLIYSAGFLDGQGMCIVCGELNPFALEQHHLFKNTDKNSIIITLCGTCHNIIHRFPKMLESRFTW